MTTITELPAEPLRGPTHLLDWLHRLPRPLSPSITYVEVDHARLVGRASQLPIDLNSRPIWQVAPAEPFAVLVLELPDAELKNAALEYLLALNTSPPTQLLDLLLVIGDRWWSAICAC